MDWGSDAKIRAGKQQNMKARTLTKRENILFLGF
jgi:hypothetical protein